jgi:hypothetical protein
MWDNGLLAFKWCDVQAQILMTETMLQTTIIVNPFVVLAIFTTDYEGGSCWQPIRVGPIFNMLSGVYEVLT